MGHKVLLIAFHFPPIGVSSGVHRTISLVKYLPAIGWEPVVLTANAHAYPRLSSAQLDEVPSGVEVVRALALDTARHLAIRGRYPRLLALPDRWSTWLPAAVVAGLSLIRKHRVDVIWSTYPIATAHLIALVLHRLSGLPWVADFRDSMTENEYPANRLVRHTYRWIEEKTVECASRLVFTAPGTRAMYERRYPEISPGHFVIVENGYDEHVFAAVEPRALNPRRVGRQPLCLVHSGILYPSERDPRPFLAAIAALRDRGVLTEGNMRVVLRATGHDAFLGQMINEYRIGGIVELGEPLDYPQAIAEMMRADGLLLFQGGNCNHQIPAKLYEYLRCRRPILALTDRAGDTAATLRQLQVGQIVDIANQADIESALLVFIEQLKWGQKLSIADVNVVRQYSRENLVEVYARLLDKVIS